MAQDHLFRAHLLSLLPSLHLLYTLVSCLAHPPLHRLEYKYSKLVMNASLKDYDLPAADSCAIMEGEDVEDDLIFTSKKSLFGKIKSFTSKVGSLAAAPRSARRAGEDGSPGHGVAPTAPGPLLCSPTAILFCRPTLKILASALYLHTDALFPGAQGCS